MSGDVVRKRKKKAPGKKKQDDILTELSTSDIQEIAAKREVTISIEEKPVERTCLGKICYASIILALLSSVACGVYVLANGEPDINNIAEMVNNAPNIAKSLGNEAVESLYSLPARVKNLQVPEFHLGAESILPNFLGTKISLPSEKTIWSTVDGITIMFEDLKNIITPHFDCLSKGISSSYNVVVDFINELIDSPEVVDKVHDPNTNKGNEDQSTKEIPVQLAENEEAKTPSVKPESEETLTKTAPSKSSAKKESASKQDSKKKTSNQSEAKNSPKKEPTEKKV